MFISINNSSAKLLANNTDLIIILCWINTIGQEYCDQLSVHVTAQLCTGKTSKNICEKRQKKVDFTQYAWMFLDSCYHNSSSNPYLSILLSKQWKTYIIYIYLYISFLPKAPGSLVFQPNARLLCVWLYSVVKRSTVVLFKNESCSVANMILYINLNMSGALEKTPAWPAIPPRA